MTAVAGRASFVTASDNRIGAMTRAMTFVNLVYCAKNSPLRRSASVPVLV
jgi:5,10-methylene-tetrahydrofolate dehydrogenase/methenyl tetrahydrofolate cyclohydrolase